MTFGLSHAHLVEDLHVEHPHKHRHLQSALCKQADKNHGEHSYASHTQTHKNTQIQTPRKGIFTKPHQNQIKTC